VKQNAGEENNHLATKTNRAAGLQIFLQPGSGSRAEELPAGFHPASETAVHQNRHPGSLLETFDRLRTEFLVCRNQPAVAAYDRVGVGAQWGFF
jgi:hypothetical protein